MKGKRGKLMKKIVLTAATVTVVGLGSAFFTDSIHAEQTEESIQEERSEIKSELSKAEAEVADVLIDIGELNQEIADLDESLADNQESLENTEEKIGTKEEEVEELKQEISELEEKIEKRFDILKDRAVSLQKSGGDVAYLEVIFGSKSFSDFVNRVSAVTKISDSDKELVEQQEADQEKVEEQQSDVEDILAELDDEKDELLSMETTIKDQQEESKDKVQQAEKKEKELTTKIAELELEDETLIALQEEVERRMNAPEETTTAVAGANSTSEETSSNTSSNESNSSSEGNTSNESNSSNDNDSNGSSSVASSSSSNGGGQSGSNDEKPSEKKQNPPQANPSLGNGVIADADKLKGTKYVSGGTSPSGFDCSGFTQYVFNKNGINLPRTAAQQYSAGYPKVSKVQLKPGDLVFFSGSPGGNNITHVGISLGGSSFIGSQTSTGVAVTSINDPYYWGPRYVGAVRPN